MIDAASRYYAFILTAEKISKTYVINGAIYREPGLESKRGIQNLGVLSLSNKISKGQTALN